eukprot:649236-Hanusia_phi.AAC.1
MNNATVLWHWHIPAEAFRGRAPGGPVQPATVVAESDQLSRAAALSPLRLYQALLERTNFGNRDAAA